MTPLVDIVDLIIADGPSQHLARVFCAQRCGARTRYPSWCTSTVVAEICGSKRTHNRLLCELAIGAQAAVVFPEYRLSPKSPESSYPTAVEECYMAVKWIAEPVAVSSSHNLDAARDKCQEAPQILMRRCVHQESAV